MNSTSDCVCNKYREITLIYNFIFENNLKAFLYSVRIVALIFKSELNLENYYF